MLRSSQERFPGFRPSHDNVALDDLRSSQELSYDEDEEMFSSPSSLLVNSGFPPRPKIAKNRKKKANVKYKDHCDNCLASQTPQWRKGRRGETFCQGNMSLFASCCATLPARKGEKCTDNITYALEIRLWKIREEARLRKT